MTREMTIALVLSAAAMSGTQSIVQRSSASAVQSTQDERICRDITLTGSRVVTKRFCGTRAEWTERERQDREEIEKSQRPMQCSMMGGRRC
jgi:hypothetical protein